MDIKRYKTLNPTNMPLYDCLHVKTTEATKYPEELINTINLRCKEADDLSYTSLACSPVVSPTRITYKWTVELGKLLPQLASLIASEPAKQYYFRRFAILSKHESQPFVQQSFERGLAFQPNGDSDDPSLSANMQIYLTEFYATICRLYDALYFKAFTDDSKEFSTAHSHLNLNVFQSLHLIAAIDLLHQKKSMLHCNVPGGTLNANATAFPSVTELQENHGIMLDQEALKDSDPTIATILHRNDIVVTHNGHEKAKTATEPFMQYWQWDLQGVKSHIYVPGAKQGIIPHGRVLDFISKYSPETNRVEMIVLVGKQPKQNIRTKMQHYIKKLMHLNYAGYVTRVHPVK